MKKTYIIVIVLVLVVVALFFVLKSKKLEAPTNVNTNELGTTGEENSPVSNTMPVPGADGLGVQETIIVGEATVKEFTISGQNFSFSPSSITVKKGDKVKITFKNTSGFHNFVIDEFGVATQQAASPSTEVLEFTADKVGSFEYYCSVGSHRSMGMKGILKVE